MIILSLLLLSISQFYFCLNSFSNSKQKLISDLQKAIGDDVIICDNSTDAGYQVFENNNPVNGQKNKNHTKKMCDCNIANTKNKFFASKITSAEPLYISHKIKYIAYAYVVAAANVYSISSPRSPPFSV